MDALVGTPWLRCPKCGYDLRGLTENRCLECGTVFDPDLLKSGRVPARWPAAQPLARFFAGLLFLVPGCLILSYAVRASYDAFDPGGRGGSAWHIKNNDSAYFVLALFAPQIIFGVGILALLKGLRDRLRFAGADNIVGILGVMLFLLVPLFFIVFMCAGGLSSVY